MGLSFTDETKIVKHRAKEFNPEDLIADKEEVLVYTSGGYVKRTDPSEFRTQKRGGVGVVDLNTKEEIKVFQIQLPSSLETGWRWGKKEKK